MTVSFPSKHNPAITGALGKVQASGWHGGWWNWVATYSDGSGARTGTTNTKRGAMICAINACRCLSNNFDPNAKYKWVND